jgi:carboxyl-terminal processing protease
VQNVIEMEGGKSALKLTTASYKRPNGKNIHRFPDASENDEWGVRPNDGFEDKLSNSDMRQLVEQRHDRDIVRRRTPTAIAAAIAGANSASTPAGKADVDSATATDSPMSDRTADDKAQRKPADPSIPANVTPTSAADDKPAATDKTVLSDNRRGLGDRQLQQALEYLAKEIAKAK